MRLPAFVLMALMGSATFAFAENSLGLNQVQSEEHKVTFTMINADADGVVQIYDFQGDQVGKLLGTHPIMAGANPDITVSLEGNPETSALAVLVVGGEPVAMQHISFTHD